MYRSQWPQKLQASIQDTSAVSVRWFDHMQVQKAFGGFRTWEEATDAVWGGFNGADVAFWPSHPDGSVSDQLHFLDHVREKLAAQQLRRAGAQTRSIMPVHSLFDAGETLDRSAQRVRADFPTEFPSMQIKREVRLLDFSIAYWRTFAGFHWPNDNRTGLALGQYIIKEKIRSTWPTCTHATRSPRRPSRST